MICLSGLPLPPSSNNQYKTVLMRGKMLRVPSADYKKFKADFGAWLYENKRAVEAAREKIAPLADAGLKCSVFLGFAACRLVSQKGKFKRLDVSNRMKALHDIVADALGIDDSCFVSVTAEKFYVEAHEKESSVIKFEPCELRPFGEPF